MRYNVLIEMPEDDEIGTLEPDTQDVIVLLKTEYPKGHIAPGTSPVSPKKLIHAVIDTNSDDVETLLESLIIIHGLDWLIVGVQSLVATEPILEELPDTILNVTTTTTEVPNPEYEAYILDPEQYVIDNPDVIVEDIPETILEYNVETELIDLGTTSLQHTGRKAKSVINMNETAIFDYMPDKYAEYDVDGVGIGSPLAKTLDNLHVFFGSSWD